MRKKRILIVGLFLDEDHHIPTQAMSLADLLKKNGYEVLTVSNKRNKILRLVHTILFIIGNAGKFDVGVVQVYSGLSIVWEYAATLLMKLFGKKVVMVIHGGGLPAKMVKHKWRHLLLLKMADKLTAPSTFMVRAMSKYGLDVQLIENVIQLDRYTFHKKTNIRPAIFWMRALSPIYNPEMAIKVVNELKTIHNYPDVKLYMAGPDMGSKQYVQDLISQYGLEEHVALLGFINMNDKAHYTELCDVYICTNRVDNAPVSFLEMMAFGIPIVSTNVGGIPDLVTDNETALLVNDEDHIAMALKVNDLIKEPAIAARLINNGKEKVNDYSEERVYRKWDALFMQL